MVDRDQEVKQELEGTVKQDRRQNTALKESNVEQEEARGPLTCHDCRCKLLIVIEDELLDQDGDMVPVQRKLD